MAEVLPQPQPQAQSQPVRRSAPIAINTAVTKQPAAQPQHQTPQTQHSKPQVDQDGSYHLDKVLKNGWLMKRARKTKGWKRRWFVLRADRLSCYKDQKEYKIHRQIYLTDVTAVAALKDAKSPNTFGVFTSNKTFHFKGETPEETNDWVEKIRNAAIDDGDDAMVLHSPMHAGAGAMNMVTSPSAISQGEHRLGSSSSDFGTSPGGMTGIGKNIPPGRMSTQTLDYSGPEVGSVSSISEFGGGARISQLSLSHVTGAEESDAPPADNAPPVPEVGRKESGLSQVAAGEEYPRVVWHGFLYCLKSSRGVKQWKKYWIVVRNVNIAFYKNEEEYKPLKLLPLDGVIDAVEVDPLSRSKKYCLQIITEGKVYRFAARDEETLAKSLGAMKSTLAKKAANVAKAVSGPNNAPAAVAPAPEAAPAAAAQRVSQAGSQQEPPQPAAKADR